MAARSLLPGRAGGHTDGSSDVPTDGRSTRWAGHREQRRAAMVEAAIRVIEAQGADASVEDVARECGVTRQVLYRQFDGRDDLDAAIAERCAAMLLEHLEGRLGAEGGIEVGLRRAIDSFLDFVELHPALYRFTRATDAGSSGPVGDVTRAVQGIVAGVTRELLGEGPAPMPVDEVFAVGLVGLAEAVVSRWVEQPGDVSREEMTEGLVRMVLGAIATVLP